MMSQFAFLRSCIAVRQTGVVFPSPRGYLSMIVIMVPVFESIALMVPAPSHPTGASTLGYMQLEANPYSCRLVASFRGIF